MNYNELSDFEINKRVAEVLGYRGKFKECKDTGALIYENMKAFNPCNNWADGGPIIEENRISLILQDYEEPMAIAPIIISMGWDISWDYMGNHKNPLRAAMICFLMMKEGEK